MIFTLFKPLKIKQQTFGDIPQVKMNEFTIYELNREALQTLVTGSQALKYKDRYIFKEVDFTDNSQKMISNIQAYRGLYKNNILYLDGNVSYSREDGFVFRSKSLIYDTKSAIAHTDDNYTASSGENSMRGTFLQYLPKKKRIKSKNVVVKYQIEERKK